MLIVDNNCFVVEIPKTGSSTLQWIVDKVYNGSVLNGHHPVSEAKLKNENKNFSQIVAVVRNPEDRLVSAVNYCLKNAATQSGSAKPKNKSAIAKEASQLMKGAIKGYSKKDGLVKHFCFRTQQSFLDTADKVKIFTFNELHLAARHLGWNGDMPHINQGEAWIAKSDLQVLTPYKELLPLYEADMKLYESFSIFEV
jgi:hypothetical protein